MRLQEAIIANPTVRIFRVDKLGERPEENGTLNQWTPQFLREQDGFFIIQAKNILPDGSIRDCYIDVSLPERISDYAYCVRGGSLEARYHHEFEGEIICAVPISSFGVYGSFYSKTQPNVGIEVLKGNRPQLVTAEGGHCRRPGLYPAR